MHWLLNPVVVTPLDRQRPTTGPQLVDRVQFRVEPNKGKINSVNAHDYATRMADEIRTLTKLGITLPKPVVAAADQVEAIRSERWPGLTGDLPPLPTLEAESKRIFHESKKKRYTAAVKALRRALTAEGETIYAALKKLIVNPALNGTFEPILRIASTTRQRTWGQLSVIRPNTTAYTPINFGDIAWFINDLNEWTKTGYETPATTALKTYGATLRTPHELIDTVRDLGIRVAVEEAE